MTLLGQGARAVGTSAPGLGRQHGRSRGARNQTCLAASSPSSPKLRVRDELRLVYHHHEGLGTSDDSGLRGVCDEDPLPCSMGPSERALGDHVLFRPFPMPLGTTVCLLVRTVPLLRGSKGLGPPKMNQNIKKPLGGLHQTRHFEASDMGLPLFRPGGGVDRETSSNCPRPERETGTSTEGEELSCTPDVCQTGGP